MAHVFENLADLYAHGYDAVIDVRSPAEFALDHIPGALNLAVLGDAERARVGTIYTQDCAFNAKKIGAALVAQNAAAHLLGPLADKDGAWRPLVYCWRGGQRSGSFATILKQVGWRAEVINGGYQTYRRLVNHALYSDPLGFELIVLEGNTGTAKTELLHLLAARGAQVLDLEGLAAHRGSVFGVQANPQPSQRGFESALAVALSRFDPARPVLVEAESSKIGRLLIPPAIWQGMKTAPRLRVSAPLGARAAYLVRAYCDLLADSSVFCDTLAGLIPHQGRARVEHWQGLSRAGAFEELARELMEFHYDPSYSRSGAAHARTAFAQVESASLTPDALELAADQLWSHVAKFSDEMHPV